MWPKKRKHMFVLQDLTLEVGLLELCVITLCCWNYWLWFLILACVLFLWNNAFVILCCCHQQQKDRDLVLLFLTGAKIIPHKFLNKCTLMIHIYKFMLWGKNGSKLSVLWLRNQFYVMLFHWCFASFILCWAGCVSQNQWAKPMPVL